MEMLILNGVQFIKMRLIYSLTIAGLRGSISQPNKFSCFEIKRVQTNNSTSYCFSIEIEVNIMIFSILPTFKLFVYL